MTGTTRIIRLPTGSVLSLLLLLAVTLATRAPYLGNPAPSFDEQLYNLIGQQMLHGALPYVDLWDRKPIGLFLIFAFSAWFGDLTGLGQVMGYQVVAMLFTLAGTMLTWRLAAREGTRMAALAAGIAYPVFMGYYGSFAGQSEAFYVPLMLAMLALVEAGSRKAGIGAASRYFGMAMLIGGLALQIKYTVAPQCAFLGLAALWQLHRKGARLPRLIPTALTFGLLGLLPTAMAGLFYALAGYWDEFLFANFISIFDRGSTGQWFPKSLLPFFLVLAMPAIAGPIALAIGRQRPTPAYLLRTGWAASCVASLFMGSTIYAYYFAALVPAAALMAMPLFSRLGRWPLAALIVLQLVNYHLPDRFAQSRADRAALARIARLAAPHVDDREHCLYVFDGPSALYRATSSCLPSRFIYPDHLNNALEAHALGIDTAREVRRILARKPGAIITANRAVTIPNQRTVAIVRATLAREYHPVASVAFNGRVLTVHLRNDGNDGRPG
ncbi:hypothetical protein [Altererythrobacter fulvus]|uniref:ArnT family glycosyltransferase n=1 Tax=Caenibius fulvus TaxID=2126012 RepID=UPI0030162637